MSSLSRPKVVLLHELDRPSLELLSRHCGITGPFDDTSDGVRRTLAEIADTDGILCSYSDTIDKEMISRAAKLRVLSCISETSSKIDIEAATKAGVYVTLTTGTLSESVADFTWLLILAAARQLFDLDRYIRQTGWTKVAPPDFLGVDVHSKTLGLIGLGRIGREVARRAMGFKMRCIYYDVVRAPREVEDEVRATYASMDQLLGESDIVSIHTSLTKETYHLIDASKIALMKKSAIVVNTARGAIIDESALINALSRGDIAVAALDVFEEEPLSPSHPIVKLRNVILTPHQASSTIETRAKTYELAVQNLLSVLAGERPRNLANPAVEQIRPLTELKIL